MNNRFDKRSSNFRRSSGVGKNRMSTNSKYREKNSNYSERNKTEDRRDRNQFNRNFSRNEESSYKGRRDRINEERYSNQNITSNPNNKYRSNNYKRRKLEPGSNFDQRISYSRKSNDFNSSTPINNLDSSKNNNYQNNLYEQLADFLWGRHATQAAFETGRPIHRIWCTSELRNTPKFFQFIKDAKSSGVLVEEVSWARLGQITKGAVHQGIALQTAAAETLDLKKLIDGCNSLNESPLLLALDGLTDPHNLGAIIRSAESFGAHGLILPQRRSAGLTGSVAKVAAGALEHLPVARVVNLNRSLVQLKDVGYKVLGLAAEGASTLQEVDLEGPLVVVIGSEDKGLSLLTRKHCDQLVRIPLRGQTTSLNASVATSVVLYEIARNSWMKSISGQAPSPKLVRANFSIK